jgi:acyl-coenzyme A synthetase/AMP-(fatty) acid ligase
VTAISQPFNVLVDAAAKHAEALAVSSPGGDMTFAELLDGSRRIAGVLREAGVRPGEVVAFRVPQLLDAVLTFACFHEAAIGTVLPAGFEESGSRVIDWVVSTAPVTGFTSDRQIILDQATMERISRQDPSSEAREYPALTSVCHIVFSSGTTGNPKPIPISIETLNDRCVDRREQWMLARPYFCQLGFSSMMGFQTFIASVVIGDTFVTPRLGKDAIDAIARFGIVCSVASPHQWGTFLPAAVKSGFSGGTLTTIVAVGAILPDFLADQLARRFGAEIAVMYAASECGSIALRHGTDSSDGFTGELVPGAEVIILNADGAALPEGEVGEIGVRRGRQPVSYFGDDAPSLAVWRDGYFFPGDSGFLRGDRLYLTGRTGDLINAAGAKIDPARVDALALEFPGVTDAAVFGFVDTRGLTTVALVFTAEEALDVDAFSAFLVSRLGDSSPRRMARVAEIPRTRTGKVNRESVAELFTQAHPDAFMY